MNAIEQRYYAQLFTQNLLWSSPFPNPDEAARWAHLCVFLALIAQSTSPQGKALRILDVGCGRGWLTYQASAFGVAEGIDPVTEPIKLAQARYPGVRFRVGTLEEVARASASSCFDVVIASEVIEHVQNKGPFVEGLKTCLVPGGHALITTPRGELYKRWCRIGQGQPVEEWLTEREVEVLFQRHGFLPRAHERVFLHCGDMSLLHRLARSPREARILERLGLTSLLKGLRYLLGFYQVWWFQAPGSGEAGMGCGRTSFTGYVRSLLGPVALGLCRVPGFLLRRAHAGRRYRTCRRPS